MVTYKGLEVEKSISGNGVNYKSPITGVWNELYLCDLTVKEKNNLMKSLNEESK